MLKELVQEYLDDKVKHLFRKDVIMMVDYASWNNNLEKWQDKLWNKGNRVFSYRKNQKLEVAPETYIHILVGEEKYGKNSTKYHRVIYVEHKYFLTCIFENYRYENMEGHSIHTTEKYETFIDLIELNLTSGNWSDSDIDLSNNTGYRELEYFLSRRFRDNVDVLGFLGQYVTDGVFKPEPETKKLYNNLQRERLDEFHEEYGFYAPFPDHIRLALKQLNVHTIRLRSKVHFDVKNYHDIEGMKIKAPKKVIEKYDLEDYCADEKIVQKLKEEEEARKKAEELEIHMNTYSLVQHGKTILDNVQKWEIVRYLENIDVNSIDNRIIETVKPLFDEYEEVDKIYLAYWGTFFKYELAGERIELDFETDSQNIKHLGVELYNKTMEFHSDCYNIPLSERIVELKWGWTERGATILGVERCGNSFYIFTEDYDCE